MPDPPRLTQLLKDGEWAMRVCNACRYCEGFCAVFPAMEKKLSFAARDLTYLANLCHDCRECLYSCQYAPPHAFGLNVPKVMAGLRAESYQRHARPATAGRILRGNRTGLILSLVLGPTLFLLAALAGAGQQGFLSPHSVEQGSFYRLLSHRALVGGFSAVGVYVVAALGLGFRSFWAEIAPEQGQAWDRSSILTALRNSLSLRYLGHAEGCAYPDESASNLRRIYHHFVFWGFTLCLASTTVAAVYHNALGWPAPYAWGSLPVILGIVGGLGLLIGPAGLLYLKWVSDRASEDRGLAGMDVAFLVLLWTTSLTGLLLLILRETAAMGVLLVLHLGVVLGLFLTLPYGKFVHGIYRFAALVRYAKEEHEP